METKSKTVYSKSIIGIDFSGEERRAFLQKLQRSPRFKKTLWKRNRAECLIGTDVSKSDHRSVKAQLAGKSAWRVLWWDFNCWVCKVMNPRMSGEQVMFAFHRRHHEITLAWVRFALENKQLYHTTYRYGAWAGLRLLIEQERAAEHGDET